MTVRYPARAALFVIALLLSFNLLAQQDNKVRMALPGVNGVLEVDAGTPATQMSVRPDGKEAQLQALHRPDDLVVSAYLHEVEFTASAEKCRDEWWPVTEMGALPQPANLEKSVKNGIARVEYTVEQNIFDSSSPGVQQKHVHAYLGGRNLCAEIELFKSPFQPGDQKLFDQVVASARLLPDESKDVPMPPTQDAYPASHAWFAQASKLYSQGNYSAAAEYYQRALDLEKQNRTFPRDTFRVLIDNLGLSYGISGKLPQAKQVFEYGLTQNQDPVFYYNLACTYAEMGKMDEAITVLSNAYWRRSNMPLGETLPDPLQDNSFRKYVDNDKFVKAVVEMQQR